MASKFFKVINRLITKSEAKCLKRAATLLAQDDKYDEYFYKCLRNITPNCTDYSVPIGEDYILFQAKCVEKHVNGRVVEED